MLADALKVGAGRPAPVEPLLDLGLPVVEDAAQAHGVLSGVSGTAAVYSFTRPRTSVASATEEPSSRPTPSSPRLFDAGGSTA